MTARAAWAAVLAACLASAAPGAETLSGLRRGFVSPPESARIMMRWWWFGPGVTNAELAREMRVMKAAGIGGVEVQPVYPLDLDDPSRGFKNLPYLSAGFLDALRFAASEAAALGLRYDLTLASGWPYGGPSVPVTEAAGRLRVERIPIPAGATSAPAPALSTGETLLAVFLDPDVRLPGTAIAGGRLHLDVDRSRQRLAVFFIASRTGMMVKRAAAGAEGFVVDHYDGGAVRNYLASVADTLARSFGPHPPYAVFSDSLEVVASDWTPSLASEFQRRRGYDLTPLLPALAFGRDARSAAVRHDWGRTLTELAEQNYLAPIEAWAHAHGVLFRSQTYGEPPVALSSNAIADLPEGEGFRWREFCETRWAASAAHIYGRPVISSETWTWLHTPSFRATALDMKAEADRHFLQGVNQLVGHGWPYSPPGVPEPGWAFYAAGALSEHNPWWFVMPDLARYLQRVSGLLRAGKPVIDVALFLPTDDAWAQFRPGQVSLNQAFQKMLAPALVPTILDSGYGLDFVDNAAVLKTTLHYPAVVVPSVERIPVDVYRRLEEYARSGGRIIFTRRAPSLAPGLMRAEQESAEIQAISRRLLDSPNARLVDNEGPVLARALGGAAAPDVTFEPPAPEIGFVHRHSDAADVYFLANTSNRPVTVRTVFRSRAAQGEFWDPFTGTTAAADTDAPLKFAPYESRLVVFAKSGQTSKGEAARTFPRLAIDVSSGWRISFPSLHRAAQFERLASWTDNAETRYFSGIAVYRKSIDLPASFLRPGAPVRLDFGPGSPVPDPGGNAPGMRALLDPPIHEAARITVNGAPAGVVWHPPYSLDIGKFVHAGANSIEIEVGNSALNALAGRALPDYRLLKKRYGDRFTPQGFDHLAPVPSGIAGPVTLVSP